MIASQEQSDTKREEAVRWAEAHGFVFWSGPSAMIAWTSALDVALSR